MSESKALSNNIKIDIAAAGRERSEDALQLVCNELEQRMAERTDVLKKSETLLLEMTTQVPGVVYQFYARPNGEMGFYYISDRSEQVLGLKSDLEGYFERFTALVVPEHREGFIKSIEKAVKESVEWKYEGILQKPTGEKIWFSGNSNPSPRENEIVFNGIVQDITERKRAEIREKLAHDTMALLNDPQDTMGTIASILQLIKQSMGFEAIGVRLCEGEDFPYYETKGFSEDFVLKERYLCARDDKGNIIRDIKGNAVLECMCGNILSGRFDANLPFFTEGGSFWTNSTTDLLTSTTEKERQARTRNYCNTAGYESVALIPLKAGSSIIGILQINDHKRDSFTLGVIHFFERLGASIGIAFSRKLAEDEARIKDVAIASSINAIAIADPVGNLMYVNDSFLKLWGYDNEEDVIGKPYAMFWEDQAQAHVVAGALRQSGQWAGELNAKKKDGSIIIVQLAGNIILDSAGNAEGMMASFIDITERKRAQDEIVKARDYVDNIIKTMFDTLIVINPDGKIRSINEATAVLLGYKEEELIGKPFGTIVAEEEEEEEGIPFIGTRLKQLIKEGFIKEYDMTYKTKSGELIPVSFSGAVMRDKDGGLIGIVCIGRDLRERKKTEEASRESERKLKELVDKTTHSQEELRTSYTELKASKDDLVRSEKLAYTGRIAASIAHEIRNPLTNVSMSVRQLKKGNRIKPEGFKHSEIIERNVERINFLITELLNCARPAKLNPVPYDIHRVIKDALISNKNKIRSQRIKTIKLLDAKTSILKIDKEHMGRVLLNLITNAVDAMPRGGNLTISTEINKDLFLIKVKDSGVGIPEKDVIKIFDPFFSTKPQGVGLGLTTCYGIVVSHGGTIEVESKWRKGTTFIISLPMDTHTQRERERERERERARARAK